VKDERIYLGHIRDAISDIRAYASVGEGAFLADRMRQDAIIRKLEIIGEAVKRLSEETRAQRPEIPWKQIAGMRDRLTHAYFGVDLGLVWRVVEWDLQALEAAVAVLVDTSNASDESRGSA
jgi:uncharacterized protein with HEPN domain